MITKNCDRHLHGNLQSYLCIPACVCESFPFVALYSELSAHFDLEWRKKKRNKISEELNTDLKRKLNKTNKGKKPLFLYTMHIYRKH